MPIGRWQAPITAILLNGDWNPFYYADLFNNRIVECLFETDRIVSPMQPVLTHCGVVTPYGVKDLGQDWPDGTKPLAEILLTYQQWRPVIFIWQQTHDR